MNSLERELEYPLGDTLPEQGASIEVAPGVRWVRMALPFALNHINLWLLRDEIDGRQGWTVVDCCIARDESRAQWERVFETQLEGLPILRVIATHMHPDHIGLAAWLCARWDCRLWISATDYYAARVFTVGTVGHGGEGASRFHASHGLSDPEALARIGERSGYYASMVPEVPRTFRRLQDGDVLRIGGHAWRCIAGYGHAPEHMSLACEALQVLISGDMMLPRISTNVAVHESEPEANPLAAFLDSIDRFRELPAGTLTLPAHGKPFRGLHRRIEQLHEHHRARLDEVLQACRERPCSAGDILAVIFPRALDMHQITFAMGESLAHLHALWHAGLLQRKQVAGVWRFAVAQDSARDPAGVGSRFRGNDGGSGEPSARAAADRP